MTTYDYMKEAKAIEEDLIAIRRHLHQMPETGFDLPNTVAYVKEQLKAIGIEAHDIGDHGVTAVIGKKGGKTLLLRADMDGLPIEEKSGEAFASTNGNMHACGHDIHMTCLLGAARMLKENEDQLEGQIKFIFQPAEELLVGGGEMVKAGILENPTVDAAMGLHVWSIGGQGISTIPGTFMSSAGNFEIKIKGVGAHGALPQNGVDPVYIGSQIVIGAPEILARELAYDKSAAITMGYFSAEGAVNVIPNEATLRGTVRTFSNDSRLYIRKRLPELVSQIAKAYRGEATLEFLSDCPVLENDEDMTHQSIGYLNEIIDTDQYPIEIGKEAVTKIGAPYGSEDFAYYANEVPSFFFLLRAADKQKDNPAMLHNETTTFNEDMIKIGAASMAHCATRWLQDQAK